MSTEDKRSKIEKAKAMTKEAKSALKRIGKKVVDSGKELVDDLTPSTGTLAKGAVALTAMGALSTEANAQAPTYDQLKNAPEMHVSSNGTVTMRGGARQTTTTVRQSGRTVSYQAVARNPIHKGVELEFSPIWSDGLHPDYYGAYVKPTEEGTDRESVYYYKVRADGKIYFDHAVDMETANYRFMHGTSEYIVQHRRGPMMFAGGGYYVGDDWDRAIAEAHHTMDQVEDMVYTVARAGEMVGDILHIGNRVGGRIQREAKRGTRTLADVRAARGQRGGRR